MAMVKVAFGIICIILLDDLSAATIMKLFQLIFAVSLANRLNILRKI